MPYYKKRFKRKYTGIIPDESRYTRLKEKLRDKKPGVYWGIFMRNDFKSGDAWLNLKIKLNNAVSRNKANYWMGYNLVERRFAKGEAFFEMQEREPGLLEQLQKLIHTVNCNNYC